MSNFFSIPIFQFPYRYKFPGQASDEEILFVVRENKIVLYFRQSLLIAASLAFLFAGWWLASLLSGITQTVVPTSLIGLIRLSSIVLATVFLLIGWWWISTLWKKSVAIVTNKRLTKFIYTTPASRHSLTLPLEMIVDTGAYSKGFIQNFLKLGIFTARSAAASSGVATDNNERVNKKYFYIENIAFVEDLQQYVSKLLSEFRASNNRLVGFRPFISNLKGDVRKEFLRKNFPEYL